MPPLSQDFYRLAPEIVLCATGALVMLVEPFLSSRTRRVAGELALELHPGRLSQGRSQVERIGDEVFPAGFVCDGVFPVWNCAAVRRNGNDNPSSNERFWSTSEPDARAAGSGADLHWTGVQSRGGPISSVDTGRIRRRADTGHSVVLCRAEGGCICAASEDFCHGNRGAGFLVLGAVDRRCADDVRGKPGRAGADEPEAPAGV